MTPTINPTPTPHDASNRNQQFLQLIESFSQFFNE